MGKRVGSYCINQACQATFTSTHKSSMPSINNQYNTFFWMLVKSGKTEREAQEFLKVCIGSFAANLTKYIAFYRSQWR